MYPYSWEAGERPRPKAESTFADFQALPEEVREVASLYVLGMSYNEMFDVVFRKYPAANDDDDPQGIPDKVTALFLDKNLMAMLRCWVSCNKDMVLTKLTYEEGGEYGTESEQ